MFVDPARQSPPPIPPITTAGAKSAIPAPLSTQADPSASLDGKKITALQTPTQKYKELIGNLPEAELEKIDTLNDPKKVERLCRAIKNGDYKTLDCTDPDMLHYCLQAVKNEKLDVEEFAMASIYWSIRKYHSEEDVQIVPLFDRRGEVNAEARAVITQTMRVSSTTGVLVQGTTEMLTDPEIDTFFDRMKNKPKSQQFFFVMDDLEKIQSLEPSPGAETRLRNGAPQDFATIQRELNVMTIGQSIYTGSIGVNAFSRFDQEGSKMRMFPSWNMVQIFLDIKFDDQAVQLYPIIDYAKLEQIEQDGRTGRRVVSLPFPGIEYRQADDFVVRQDYDMLYHDLVYHGYRASLVPANDQKAFILLSETAKKLIKKYDFFAPLPQLLYERFIDMELPYFQKQPVQFFDAITIFISQSTLQARVREFRTRYKDQPEKIEQFKAALANNRENEFPLFLNEHDAITGNVNLKIDLLIASGYTLDLVDAIIQNKEELEKLGISFSEAAEVVEERQAAIDRSTQSLSPELKKIAKRFNIALQVGKALKAPHQRFLDTSVSRDRSKVWFRALEERFNQPNYF